MNDMRENKRSTSAPAARIRAVAIMMAIVVVAIAVCVALQFLPARWRQIDLANSGMDHITDTTKTFLASLDEDITIYWLRDAATADDRVEMFLDCYDRASDRVTVEIKDLDYFTELFGGTQVPDEDNYIVVKSDKRQLVETESALYYYRNEMIDSMAGQEYKMTAEEVNQYVAYVPENEVESYWAVTTVHFHGEALLTGMIDYVTAELSKAYTLTGHGEAELVMTENDIALWKQMGLSTETLDLQKAGAMPSDADRLIINAPTKDITDAECAMILSYMAKGGSVILVTDGASAAFPNLAKLGAVYGLTAEKGIVVDPAHGYHVADEPSNMLLPAPGTHDIAAMLGTYYLAMMPNAHGIKIADTLPAGVSASAILCTSEESFRLSGEGPLSDPASTNVAVAAQKTVTDAEGASKTAKLVWFGSSEAFGEDAIKMTSVKYELEVEVTAETTETTTEAAESGTDAPAEDTAEAVGGETEDTAEPSEPETETEPETESETKPETKPETEIKEYEEAVGNNYYMAAALSWMTGRFSSEYNDIPSVQQPSLGSAMTISSSAITVIWGIVTVALIPVGALAGGLLGRMYRRRRRE